MVKDTGLSIQRRQFKSGRGYMRNTSTEEGKKIWDTVDRAAESAPEWFLRHLNNRVQPIPKFEGPGGFDIIRVKDNDKKAKI